MKQLSDRTASFTDYDELLAKYTHKRQLMCEGLDAIGLKQNVPEGAYYIMIDVKEFILKTGLTYDMVSKGYIS